MTEHELGDAAFDCLDRMLDDAEFRKDIIILYRGEDAFPCYSLYSLKAKLTEVARAFMEWKYNQVPTDLEDIVQNAVEEYDDEIRDSFARDMRPKVFNPAKAVRNAMNAFSHAPKRRQPPRRHPHSQEVRTPVLPSDYNDGFPRERPSTRHKRVG